MRIITTKSHSCLITANAEETAAKQDHALGDVNNDSHINAVDASSVLSYYAMLIEKNTN